MIDDNLDKYDKLKKFNIFHKFKSNKKRVPDANRELYVITCLFVGLFFCMLGYFVYYVGVDSPEEINNSYNMRQENLSKKVIRGKILSEDKQILAQTRIDEKGEEVREYPFANLFAHAIGFSTRGKTGMEALGNISLLTSNAYVIERIQNNIDEEKNIGDNLITTYNVKLQQVASEALGIYKGAIIVMEPDTGKILAMVSKPDFDPNYIDKMWDSVIADESGESVLLNRVTQGLYPPGSTFKIVTALEYIRENRNTYETYRFSCNGQITKDDVSIDCYHNTAHGAVDIFQSFAKSCNCSFANIGLALQPESYQKTCEKLMFNKKLPIRYPYKESEFYLDDSSTTEEIMQTAIGQGKTLITPMHMAMITSAIANKGNLKKPYAIERIENYNGDVIRNYESPGVVRLLSEEEANTMTLLMADVVQNGTGKKLKDLSYTAAGKTGSAEYGTQKGNSHAWFTGFAPSQDPKIVVTILIEGAGSGGEYAVPIAKRIFDAYFN